MTRNRWLIVAAVVIAIAGVVFFTQRGSSGPDTSKPDGALLHQFDLLKKGQYGRAYDEIVPTQQALFTREQYISCLTKQHPIVGGVTIKEIFTEHVAIPGTDQQLDSTAVTAEIEGLFGKNTQTFHEFNINGQWRFSVTDVDEARNGTC